MLLSRYVCRALLPSCMLACSFCAIPAAAQQPSEAAQIAALKEQIAQQNKRISLLEREVQLLLAAKNGTARVSTAPAEASGALHKSSSLQTIPKSPSGSCVSPHPSKQGVASAATTAEAKVTLQSAKSSDASAHPPHEIQIAGIHVGGDVYLFQYVPFSVSGVQPKFELYAFSLQLNSQRGPWDFAMDYRFRTTKLRPYYPGNTWLQQGYVGYRTPFGEIKGGSFYRRVGLDWDGSFFGNIQYFDGLKLDPEFGVGFEGAHTIAGKLGAEYSVQYFTDDAGVNGSLPGRDFVSESGAHAKNDFTFRFAPVWHFTDNLSLTVGGSYAHGLINRTNGPHNIRSQVAGDATLEWRGLLAYGEVLNQQVEGAVIEAPQDATYTLFGARWARGRFQPRFNFSAANYHGFQPRREYIVQPGITIHLADGFSFLYEFDYWEKTSIPDPSLLDKSLNFVLHYHF